MIQAAGEGAQLTTARTCTGRVQEDSTNAKRATLEVAENIRSTLQTKACAHGAVACRPVARLHFVTPKGVPRLAVCDASATRESL